MKEQLSIFVETRSGGAMHIFAKNCSDMINIDDEAYEKVAHRLTEAVGEGDFFSGSVDCDHGGFSSTFTTTLLIYRNDDYLPEGVRTVVSDIVPVWWEFSTTTPSGKEGDNDFCFSDFRKQFLTLHKK